MDVIKRLGANVDGRDFAALLGLVLVSIGLGMVSVPLALVTIGTAVLAVSVGPVVVVGLRKVLKG